LRRLWPNKVGVDGQAETLGPAVGARDSRGLVRIPQQDGSTFAIDRMKAHIQVFTYLFESMHADGDASPRPDPPPVLVAVAGAKDRPVALKKVLEDYNNLPVDPEALIETGSKVPVSLVAGYTYEELMERGGVPDLSEPSGEG
jgi:hypothetical protein